MREKWTQTLFMKAQQTKLNGSMCNNLCSTDYSAIDQTAVLQRILHTFLIREHFHDAERSEREKKRRSERNDERRSGTLTTKP